MLCSFQFMANEFRPIMNMAHLQSQSTSGILGTLASQELKNQLEEHANLFSMKDDTLSTTFRDIFSNVLTAFPTEIPVPFIPSGFVLVNHRLFISSPKKDVAQISVKDRSLVFNNVFPLKAIWAISYLDEQHLICSDMKEIHIVNIESLSIVSSFKGHSRPARKLILTESKEVLYSMSVDNTVRKWSVADPTINELLYTCPSRPVSMDLDRSEEFLALAATENTIYILDLSQGQVHCELPCDFKVSELKFTFNLLGGAGENSSIALWKVGSWELIRRMTGTCAYYETLAVSLDESMLIVGSRDGVLEFWNISDEHVPPVVRNVGTDTVNNIIPTKKAVFFTLSAQTNVYNIRYPNIPQVQKFSIEHTNLDLVLCCQSKDYFFVKVVDNGIEMRDSQSLEKVHHLFPECSDVCFCMDPSEEFLIVYSARVVYKFMIDSKELVQLTKFTTEKVTCIAINADSSLIVLGCTTGRVFILDGQTFEVIFKDTKLEYRISFMKFSEDCSRLFTCDIITKMRMINLSSSNWESLGIPVEGTVSHTNKKTVRTEFPEDRQPTYDVRGINSLCISRDNKYLVTGGHDFTVKIWYIPSRECCWTIKCPYQTVTMVHLLENQKHLLIGCSDWMKKNAQFSIYDFPSKTMMTYKDFIGDFYYLASLHRERSVMIMGNEKLEIVSNPILESKFGVFSPKNQDNEFFSYLREIMTGKNPGPSSEYDFNMITPYLFNPIHFHAYFNRADYISQSLSELHPYYEGESGLCPLGIALEKGFEEIADKILSEYLLKNLENENEYSLVLVTKHLKKLNEVGPANLATIYEKGFLAKKKPYLPEFCAEQISLPIFLHKSELEIQTNDFFDDMYGKYMEADIEFKQWGCPLPLIMGSQDSIDFLMSLYSTPNDEVFRTKFIQTLLEYKWKSTRVFMLTQGFFYFLYMILLSVFSIYFIDKNQGLTISLLVISSFLLFYEIFQMFILKLAYFTDIWNLIDLLRASLVIVICVLLFEDTDLEAVSYILTILTLISWIRGLTYFRLFKKTRYMTFLIFQACIDMSGFFILLVYSTVAFSLVFLSLEIGRSNIDFLLNSYRLSLGDFETEGFSIEAWVMFLFATLFNMIIMLNLLISIMGDTFDRVQEGIIVADYRELLEMIIEGETFMFWRRHLNGNLEFFSICNLEAADEEEETWEGRIRELKNKVAAIQNTFKIQYQSIRNDSRTINQSLATLEEYITDINNMLKEG